MTEFRSKDPLHGKTLQAILEALVERFGWEELGDQIRINCFTDNPSIKSSLTFLRKTPWARAKVEQLYAETLEEEAFRPSKPKERPKSRPEPRRINRWTGEPFEDED